MDLPASSMEYKREYNRIYRMNHPESNRVHQAKYKLKYRERVLFRAREWAKKSRKENPERHHINDRKLALMKNYGVTVGQYDSMFASQGGLCAICSKPEKAKRGYLCVDHDHSTGMVRGLLCYRCNAALGQVGDSVDVLTKMIEYLSRIQ